MLLTKSKYIQGVQCIKQLWLSSKDKTPHDIDPFQEFIFKQGEMIGEYARNMYPNGILVSENFSFIEKINFTKELVKNKQTIFEGSFLFDQCFCMVDILTPYKNGWELIEIKSSSGVKPVHIHDLSFQVYILRSLGINVLKSSIGYLNTEYVRNQILDINKLFKIHDLYNEVQLNNLQTQQNILK
ncbi:MAG: Dna2/Cas4 domain-containing protein, partial [Candidatus Margulisiibacteriota bacterium]